MKIRGLILILLLIFPVFILSSSSVRIDPSKFYLWSGFEKDASGWTTDDWKNNAFSDPSVSSDFVTEGKKGLQVPFNFTSKGQSGIVQIYDMGDASAIKEVSFDIYNSSLMELDARIMAKTGPAWQYHESKPITLKPGWNRDVKFSLTDSIYRYEGAEDFDKKIENLNFLRRFGLLVFAPSSGDGSLYIDNICIRGTDAIENFFPEVEPAGLKDVLIDNFEKGNMNWTAQSGWSCAQSAKKTKMDDGNTVMKAVMNMKQPGQNAIFAIEGSWDMSDVYSLKVDIFNPESYTMSISMSLGTGDKWTWQEHPSVKLKPGWNRQVEFDFKKKIWKNERNNWTANITPDDINSVKRISFVVIPPDMNEQYVLFDNISIQTTDPSKIETMRSYDTGETAYTIFNSFEKGVTGWESMSDQSGAVAASQAENFGGENNRGMEMSFSIKTASDKAMYRYMGNMNFADSVGMKSDFYNPFDYTVKLAVAFQTGDAEDWIETKQITLAPGWNKDVFIDFVSATFKSAESNWNYTENFFTRNDIRDLILQIYTERPAKGAVYMTDIKLARRNLFGDPGKSAGFTLVNNSSMTMETISYINWPDGNFENSDGGWHASLVAGWGAAESVISDKFASQGKKSLKLTFKDIPNKIGYEYTAASSLDISGYDYMAFDIYNPGRKAKYAVAFKINNTAGTWYESKELVLSPGWNKNIRVNIKDSVWKTVDSKWSNNIPLENSDNIKNIYIIASGVTEGAIYLDNVRWGKKGPMTITDAVVDQDVNLIYTPNDSVEAKAVVKASYYHNQNSAVELSSAHIILRGMGNEMTVFAGENHQVFDDVFGFADSSNIGPNVMGASIAGSAGPFNTAYSATGISLWAQEPWKFGNTYLGGVRVKQPFMDTNYIGLLYMGSKRGFVDNANIITDNYEQGISTYGGDLSVFIPLYGLVDLSVKGEVLYNDYDTYNPVYMLSLSPVNYVNSVIDPNAGKMLEFGQFDIHFWDITVHSQFRHIDTDFDMTYSNTDYKAGDDAKLVNISYILDDTWPFSSLKNLSPEWAGFVNYTKLMAEYDANKVMGGTYQRDTYTFELKNDPSLGLYNYDLILRKNFEGDAPSADNSNIDTRIPAITMTGITKILAGDRLALKFLLRNQNLRDVFVSGGDWTDYTVFTAFAEASFKIMKNLKLTGNYKYMTSAVKGTHGNWYVVLEGIYFGGLALDASFGELPFTGYWLDNNNDDTKTKVMFSVRGYF